MKKIGYLVLLSVCSLKTYIKDVVILQHEKRKIVFLHDYHWDDKSTSDNQEQFFKRLFNTLPKDALVHLETTEGPHTQEKNDLYIKNNKDESCTTIFGLQQAMFTGQKHGHSFATQSFEVRNKEDTKYGVHIPYRIVFGKSKARKKLIKDVNSWVKETIKKTKQILQAPDFRNLFSKKDVNSVIKNLSVNLKPVNLSKQAQEVYKISNVQVDIKLLQNILQADNQVQVIIGGRDHLLVVADILKTFKKWQQIYGKKGYDTSVWGQKIMELTQV
jgi:hypothetical protein